MTSSLLPCLFAAVAALIAVTSFAAPATAQPGPGSGSVQDQELRVSKPLPVVRQPFQIYLAEDTPSAEVRYVVRSEATGEVVADEQGTLLSGGVGIEFTATHTGYYVATAETASPPSKQWTVRFPVVYRDLHFAIWPPLQPEEHDLRSLSTHVIVIGAYEHPETVAYWQQRGSIVLGGSFTGARQVDLAESDEANIENLVAAWTADTAGICDGIYIDEVGAYPTQDGIHKIRIINAALLRFREQNPDKLIYVATAGAPLPEQAAGYKAAGAVALLESYEPWLAAAFGTHRFYSYIDQRIEVARHTDLIHERGKMHGAVIMLGQEGLHGGTTKPQLEDAVRYIRTAAPEMPGLVFYASGRTLEWLHDTDMRAFAEELCERYYVHPVLDVNHIWLDHPTPKAGRPSSVYVRIHNVGGMQARQVRVHLYASPIGLSERHDIGSVTLDSIGVGATEVVDRSLPTDTAYTYQEVAGEKVPVFTTPATVSLDRATATFSWTPKAKGAYVLHAVVEAQDGVTLLNGTLARDIVVAGAPE